MNNSTSTITILTRNEIIEALQVNHQKFIETLHGLDDYAFMLSVNEKWTAGQQLDHILISVSAVTPAFLLPKFLLRLLFGKPDRTSRPYPELVNRYQLKLSNGAKAPSKFIPKAVPLAEKVRLINSLISALDKLEKGINSYDEDQLDSYLLPHPILGKLTLREMLYFTIYHVEHHHSKMLISTLK
ncbi:DinB family protein [Solitalea sp. MAHUQ-68]|uniref:DinB family protein n=1 Tax=Solitalea agri TaxID=2953739 RepID=A0A9X2JDC9_9SPHI|nr:DinB family protein [Solitalea agri]MCO4292780.1 DinB family protein [Solitalea agri]